MGLFVLSALVALPATAADFTLEREDSQWARDVTRSKSTYVVTAGEITLTTESTGPGGDREPRSTTATFVDTKEIDALLAVIRVTQDDPQAEILNGAKYRRGCLIEGDMKRCATVTEGTSPRLEALLELEQVLILHLFR